MEVVRRSGGVCEAIASLEQLEPELEIWPPLSKLVEFRTLPNAASNMHMIANTSKGTNISSSKSVAMKEVTNSNPSMDKGMENHNSTLAKMGNIPNPSVEKKVHNPNSSMVRGITISAKEVIAVAPKDTTIGNSSDMNKDV